jgi:hypothetical protein
MKLISDTSPNAIEDHEDPEEPPAKNEEGSTFAKFPLTIPAPGNNNNNDPKCQLIVTGITTEFPMNTNSLEGPTTNQTLHGVHVGLADFGFVMEEGDIIGATPSNNQATNNSTTPIVVSYRNLETKQRVVKAAQDANIWNLPIPTENAKRKGNVCSFKEVAVKRHRTKAERKTLEKTTPLTDGRQQIVQPINNLMEALETIRRRREEEDVMEELLRRKEQDTALARDTATPVPSGDELTPSEANLDPDEEEPDLRERLENDPGECSTSSDEENKVYRVTPFRDEWEENSHLSLSQRTFPRQTPKPQEDARDGHLSPPSPLYQNEPASQEPATSTTTPTRETREPDHDDLEMISQGPSTSGTQRKRKAHSPIIYRNSHVNTPRIPVSKKQCQKKAGLATRPLRQKQTGA